MSTNRHIYALFDSKEAAAAAYAAVQARGCSDEHCSAILHTQHLDESAVPSGENASREGARGGAVIAGTAGVVIGGLAALGGGLIGVGPLAAAVLAGGAMSLYGAAAGSIAAADEPEEQLRALERELEQGKILVAVETDDEDLEQMCEQVFEQHGGVVTHS